MSDAPPSHGSSSVPDARPHSSAAARGLPSRAGSARRQPPADDAFPCDRCGTAMFRMHAVWRCPSCGYKTDCCGW